MFPLLLARARTESIDDIARASAESLEREAKRRINGIVCYKTTSGKFFSLKSGVNYCFQVSGSFFMNGKPVYIKGYVDGVEKFEGNGVLATVGDGKYRDYKVVIRSDINQDVFVVSCLSLKIGVPCYITTKNNIDELNILQKKTYIGSLYRSYLLHLGPKTSVDVTANTDLDTSGTIDIISSDGYIYNDDTNKFSFASMNSLLITASTLTDSGTMNVRITSSGSEWITPLDGYVTVQDCHVYTESEFKEPKYENSLVVIIITIVAVIVVIVIIVCIVCCCIKKKKHEEVQGENEENNAQYPPQTGGNMVYGQPGFPQQNYCMPPYTQQPVYDQPVYPQQNPQQPVYAQPAYPQQVPQQPVYVAHPIEQSPY